MSNKENDIIYEAEAEILDEKKELSGESSKEIIPHQNQLANTDQEIDLFLAKRQAFVTKVNKICVEGKDFHVIQGKKSLAKGGAEKIASIFHWTAKFEKDSEALEMLGEVKGLVAFKCSLTNGEFVGEGRGAASLTKNGGDPNKTLKMAQKSAFIDAVLRASGLSDFFTQDIEDMDVKDISQPQTSSIPPSQKQIDIIDKTMLDKRVDEGFLIEQGFPPLKDLTGGREGTASELIGFLFDYVPTTTIVMAMGTAYFIEDLKGCGSAESYEKISGEIKIAKENGKISEADFKEIKKYAELAVKRIQSKGLKPLDPGMQKMKTAMEKAKTK